jgi:hypothetical protein
MRLISAGSLVRAQSGPLDRLHFSRRAISHKHPADHETDHRAYDIDHHIMRCRRPARNEGLMELIRRRVNHRHHERQSRRFPKTFSQRRPMVAQCAPEQSRENRILRQVTRFTHNQLDQHHGLERNVRIKPEQERQNKTRRMVRREQIGRTGKNQTHPCKSEHPINDEPANSHVQKQLQLIFAPAGNKHSSDQPEKAPNNMSVIPSAARDLVSNAKRHNALNAQARFREVLRCAQDDPPRGALIVKITLAPILCPAQCLRFR